MDYLFVKWLHNSEEYPTLIYSEIDDSRYETRKVEVYLNGFFVCASREKNSKDLGYEPIPSIQEISENKEFIAINITKDFFETIWQKFDCT